MLKFGRCVMVTLQRSPARIALFPDRGNNTLRAIQRSFPPAASNHGIFRSQTADRFRCQFATASSTGQHIDDQGAHVFRIGKSGPSGLTIPLSSSISRAIDGAPSKRLLTADIAGHSIRMDKGRFADHAS